MVANILGNYLSPSPLNFLPNSRLANHASEAIELPLAIIQIEYLWKYANLDDRYKVVGTSLIRVFAGDLQTRFLLVVSYKGSSVLLSSLLASHLQEGIQNS